MNLKHITPNRWNPIKVPCLGCGSIRDTNFMMADLDGEPFKAFYCYTCIGEKNEGESIVDPRPSL